MSQHLRIGEEAIVASIDAFGVEIWIQPPKVEFASQFTKARANVGAVDVEEASPGQYAVTVQIVSATAFIVPTKYLADVPCLGRGWKILFAGKVYEVLPMGGRPPVEASGRFNLMKRIHTKLIGDY